MTRLTWVWAMFAAGALAGDATAQQRPDFSGEWTSQVEAAARGGEGPGARAEGPGARGRGGRRGGAPGDMGSGWGEDITITQDADSLVVVYRFFTRGDMQPPLRFAFALDGSETTTRVMMGRGFQSQVSRARWQGDALVVTTTYTYPAAVEGQPTRSEVVRTLSLESPASLVVETVREAVAGGPPSTTRTVYTRQEG